MSYTFLRWAGGKRWLVPTVRSLVGERTFNNYYEPFLGGGSIFFSLKENQFKHAYLSDLNDDLINSYVQVKENLEMLKEILINYPNNKEFYYEIRDMNPTNDIERAARFIYLNNTSYNGLYRVNRIGRYNVPYGRNKKSIDIVFQKLNGSSVLLRKAKFRVCDFEHYKYRIKENDLVFLDPPYTVSHNDNGFIEYNRKLFSLNDQNRLKSYIEFIKKKGAFYILTNAAHPRISEIFTNDEDHRILVNRYSLIGGKGAERRKVNEYIFTNLNMGDNQNG